MVAGVMALGKPEVSVAAAVLEACKMLVVDSAII